MTRDKVCKMMIRPAADADVPAITALLREAGLPVDGVAGHLDGFVVAEPAGEVVATGGLELHGGDALLRSVAVDDAYRGKGAGAAICDRLEAFARERGVRDIYLLTTTAKAYFANRGYEAVARDQAPADIAATEEFTSLCPASAILMRRSDKFRNDGGDSS